MPKQVDKQGDTLFIKTHSNLTLSDKTRVLINDLSGVIIRKTIMKVIDMEQKQWIEKIKTMKQEKDILVLAHYYVDGSVQEVADFVGDSYYLSQMALLQKQQVILFCGVRFMGESAKILNPDKKIP